jgi:hypothetical protein
MIQVIDILGKEYKELEKYILRTDFDAETLKSFSHVGINSPLTEIKFNVELFFDRFKIEKYKVSFFEEKIFSIKFMTDEFNAVNIIQNLIAKDSFIFKFYTNKQMNETEWVDKDDNSKGGFTEWKTKTFKFDESSIFNIEFLDDYGLITFRSQELNIIIKNQVLNGSTFYLFELEPDIHKLFKNNFRSN